MLKALQLIFEPAPTWEAINRADRKLWQVLVLYLIPTLLIAVALESWGLYKFGNRPSLVSFAERAASPVAEETIIRYQSVQFGIIILMMFLLSSILQSVLKSMHSRVTYTKVFTAIGFSFAPYFLMIALDGLPFVNTWICRGIGAVLVAKVYYVGLVRVIKPEPTAALGAYMCSIFLVFAIIALTHFIALRVLENGFLSQFGG
jgi:hypothetical protein